MKRRIKYLSVLLILVLSGCQANNKFVGTWHYENISSVNGGISTITFQIKDNNSCQYHMVYTLLNRNIIDTTSYCSWEIEKDYIKYNTNGKIEYLYYDKKNDILYTLDTTTKEKKLKFERY